MMMFQSLAVLALTLALSVVSLSPIYADASLYEILDYDVGYDIENAELLVMNLDVDFTSLGIEIVAFDDGYIELNIPRGLLDSTFDGEDDIFFVLIDGAESDYIEVDASDTTRTLIIPIFENDEEIEIVGTGVLMSSPTAVEIPSWVKNNAGWWSEGLLGDDDFVAGIKYLINDGVIVIPHTESGESTGGAIPDWVKNNAGWWSEGLLGDDDFVAGIQYLISNGILVV